MLHQHSKVPTKVGVLIHKIRCANCPTLLIVSQQATCLYLIYLYCFLFYCIYIQFIQSTLDTISSIELYVNFLTVEEGRGWCTTSCCITCCEQILKCFVPCRVFFVGFSPTALILFCQARLPLLQEKAKNRVHQVVIIIILDSIYANKTHTQRIHQNH